MVAEFHVDGENENENENVDENGTGNGDFNHTWERWERLRKRNNDDMKKADEV